MPKTLVKARRIGGSLVVRIPREVVEQEGIREGELVELDVRKAKRDWFGVLRGLKPFSREDEMDVNE